MQITILIPEILPVDLQYIIESYFILGAVDIISSIGFHLRRKDIVGSSYGLEWLVDRLS
jgi:hypothetical protein